MTKHRNPKKLFRENGSFLCHQRKGTNSKTTFLFLNFVIYLSIYAFIDFHLSEQLHCSSSTFCFSVQAKWGFRELNNLFFMRHSCPLSCCQLTHSVPLCLTFLPQSLTTWHLWRTGGKPPGLHKHSTVHYSTCTIQFSCKHTITHAKHDAPQWETAHFAPAISYDLGVTGFPTTFPLLFLQHG